MFLKTVPHDALMDRYTQREKLDASQRTQNVQRGNSASTTCVCFALCTNT